MQDYDPLIQNVTCSGMYLGYKSFVRLYVSKFVSEM